MKSTPNSNRTHVSLFGKTNSGKSSLLNAITNQNISIVSEQKGTTTDSVTKPMELIPYGPVLFIDTAGLDDSGALGELRVKKALSELNRTDFALVILDGSNLDYDFYLSLTSNLKKHNIPFLTVVNKCDLLNSDDREKINSLFLDAIFISTKNEKDILNLKNQLIKKLNVLEDEPTLLGKLLPYNSFIVMVVPIDSEAPKGRLILPQVQMLRDALDHGIKSLVVRDTELENTLNNFNKIDLIITDSQAFNKVDKLVNNRFKLTSFSILFANQKGDLKTFIEGVKVLDNLTDGDKVLIAETCSHNTSHEDIGRIKIPNLIKKYTSKQIIFEFKMGKDFPEDLSEYSLIIHCGACMINKKLMESRIKISKNNHIPITNYGIVISYLTGILDKSIEIFEF